MYCLCDIWKCFASEKMSVHFFLLKVWFTDNDKNYIIKEEKHLNINTNKNALPV